MIFDAVDMKGYCVSWCTVVRCDHGKWEKAGQSMAGMLSGTGALFCFCLPRGTRAGIVVFVLAGTCIIYISCDAINRKDAWGLSGWSMDCGFLVVPLHEM